MDYFDLGFKVYADGDEEVRYYYLEHNDKGLQCDKVIVGEWRKGKCCFYLFIGNGFCIWYSEYFPAEDTWLEATGNIPSLELQIAFKNKIQGTWKGIEHPELNSYQFNFRYSSDVQTKAYFEGGKIYVTCDIQFDKWFLEEHVHDFPELSVLLDKVRSKTSGSLSKTDAFCSPDMIHILRTILFRKYSERRRKATWEHKVKIILLDALDIISPAEATGPKLKLSDYDTECLYKAKEIIDGNPIDKPITLDGLCRKVALNEFKLKNGFKQLFGHSPYDYYLELRMKEAKRLLLEEKNESITNIAYLIGYKNVVNFNILFKQKFGVTPGYYRRYGEHL